MKKLSQEETVVTIYPNGEVVVNLHKKTYREIVKRMFPKESKELLKLSKIIRGDDIIYCG